MDRSLQGKVIVITGASSGFGKGAALEFASLGASLALAARRKDLLDELAMTCRESGVQALALETDVSVQTDVERLYSQTISEFGRIDVWINNAGAAAIGNFTEVPISEHLQVLLTDLAGTMYGSYLALKEFIKNKHGILINVASMIGRIPAPYYASYAAAKHGVVGLSGALRQELMVQKLTDVHVCTVLPMAMDTPFFEHAANYSGHEAAPIPPLNDAQKVIDTLVDLIFDPKAETAVGKGSGIFSMFDSLAPGATEAMMAANTHKAQIEESNPSPPFPGGLSQPNTSGDGVKGKT